MKIAERPIETCQSTQKMAESSKIKKKTAEQLRDENFRRQILTFEAKGDTLTEDFSADVFLLVKRKGKLRVYTSRASLDDPQWPLRREEIARYYPLPVIKTSNIFTNRERKAKIMRSTFQAGSVRPKEETS
jgi:hypothetical protein